MLPLLFKRHCGRCAGLGSTSSAKQLRRSNQCIASAAELTAGRRCGHTQPCSKESARCERERLVPSKAPGEGGRAGCAARGEIEQQQAVCCELRQARESSVDATDSLMAEFIAAAPAVAHSERAHVLSAGRYTSCWARRAGPTPCSPLPLRASRQCLRRSCLASPVTVACPLVAALRCHTQQRLSRHSFVLSLRAHSL